MQKWLKKEKLKKIKWVFVEGCKHPKSVTLLLRGGSQRVVDEVERSVHDAIDGCKRCNGVKTSNCCRWWCS